MANTLNIELTGKYVLLNKSAFDEDVPEIERIVKVVGGFGANGGDRDTCLATEGGKLYVEFADGSSGAFRGMDVERLIEK